MYTALILLIHDVFCSNYYYSTVFEQNFYQILRKCNLLPFAINRHHLVCTYCLLPKVFLAQISLKLQTLQVRFLQILPPFVFLHFQVLIICVNSFLRRLIFTSIDFHELGFIWKNLSTQNIKFRFITQFLYSRKFSGLSSIIAKDSSSILIIRDMINLNQIKT